MIEESMESNERHFHSYLLVLASHCILNAQRLQGRQLQNFREQVIETC